MPRQGTVAKADSYMSKIFYHCVDTYCLVLESKLQVCNMRESHWTATSRCQLIARSEDTILYHSRIKTTLENGTESSQMRRSISDFCCTPSSTANTDAHKPVFLDSKSI